VWVALFSSLSSTRGRSQAGKLDHLWLHPEYVCKSEYHQVESRTPDVSWCPFGHLFLDACHLYIGYSARNDHVEVGQVGCDIESEPVPADPLLNVNADARNLAIFGPDSSVPFFALSFDAKARECMNQTLLYLAKKPVKILAVFAEVEYGIANQLAWPVERNVPSAFDIEYLNATGLKSMARRGKTLSLEGAAKCHYWRMFHQQQNVSVHVARNSFSGQFALQLERGAVGHAVKPDHDEFGAHGDADRRAAVSANRAAATSVRR